MECVSWDTGKGEAPASVVHEDATSVAFLALRYLAAVLKR